METRPIAKQAHWGHHSFRLRCRWRDDIHLRRSHDEIQDGWTALHVVVRRRRHLEEDRRQYLRKSLDPQRHRLGNRHLDHRTRWQEPESPDEGKTSRWLEHGETR